MSIFSILVSYSVLKIGPSVRYDELTPAPPPSNYDKQN